MLDSSQMPRATAALNTLWQIGASIGTALLAVVLQRESAAAMSSARGGAARLLARCPRASAHRSADRWHTAFGHNLHVGGGDGAPGHLSAVLLLRAETADAERQFSRANAA